MTLMFLQFLTSSVFLNPQIMAFVILLLFHFQLVKMGFVAITSMYHHLHVLSLPMTLLYQYLQQICLVVAQDHLELSKVSELNYCSCWLAKHFLNFISGKNVFVRIEFHSNTRTLSCMFLEPFKSGQLSCIANVFYGDSCQQFLGMFIGQLNEDTSDIVLELEDDVIDYCYSVIASNNTLSVYVEGSFTYHNGTLSHV